MPPKRRKFQRPLGERRYRKLFIVAVEGAKTEPQYFAVINNQNSVIQLECLKNRHNSSPLQVLNRIQEHLKKESLKDTDEAWLVVDKDKWADEQLTQLYNWSLGAENYGFALSNPHFEYWLLLHFEDGVDITTSRDCIVRLKRYLPNYDKSVSSRMITHEMINSAIRRAKFRDNPACVDWPRNIGCTTVYKLVEKIICA